jgi:hypothetical protein
MHFKVLFLTTDRRCGLVVRVAGYRSRGLGFEMLPNFLSSRILWTGLVWLRIGTGGELL